MKGYLLRRRNIIFTIEYNSSFLDGAKTTQHTANTGYRVPTTQILKPHTVEGLCITVRINPLHIVLTIVPQFSLYSTN